MATSRALTRRGPMVCRRRGRIRLVVDDCSSELREPDGLSGGRPSPGRYGGAIARRFHHDPGHPPPRSPGPPDRRPRGRGLPGAARHDRVLHEPLLLPAPQRHLVSPAGNTLGALAIVIPIGGGLIVGLMARFGSEQIRGHGIPEAMERILINGSRVQPRLAVLKPISSAISIGTGGPFGAEGPIILTGGALGSIVGQLFRLTAAERRALLVAGAAAGMSAVFGTPVAATLFGVELLGVRVPASLDGPDRPGGGHRRRAAHGHGHAGPGHPPADLPGSRPRRRSAGWPCSARPRSGSPPGWRPGS